MMKNNATKPAQRKTTLKWNNNGELSSNDMARIIHDLSLTELKECELACNRVSKIKKLKSWDVVVIKEIKTSKRKIFSYYLKRVFMLCAKQNISYKFISL